MYISFRESTEGEVRPPRPYMTISTSEAVQGLINEAWPQKACTYFGSANMRKWHVHGSCIYACKDW